MYRITGIGDMDMPFVLFKIAYMYTFKIMFDTSVIQ
jgi:hypothetical protein